MLKKEMHIVKLRTLLDQRLKCSMTNTNYKESPELENQKSQKTRTETDTINIANEERL